jgi:hypothetical protein
MKKKNSYRWLIWILLAVILIGVALWNILPPYLDRMKSEQDYQIDHQDELGINYPIVYSGDNEKYLRKEIFSYEDAVVGGNVYKVGYQPGEEYQTFIDEMVKNSDFDTGKLLQTTEKKAILTITN